MFWTCNRVNYRHVKFCSYHSSFKSPTNICKSWSCTKPQSVSQENIKISAITG